MSKDMLEATYNRFVFKVKKGYLYHPDECWAKEDGGLITVGITDFLQKTNGSVLSLELPEVGAEVVQDGEADIIEAKDTNKTFKTAPKSTVTIISPASGIVKEVNVELEDNQHFINSDPYGAGWLFKLAPVNWEAEKNALMKAEEYFPLHGRKN